MSYTALFFGAVALSVVHVAIPNHWLPLLALSRDQGWGRQKLAWVTAVAGFAHTLSTVLIGIAVGYFGLEMSRRFEDVFSWLPSLLLGSIGLVLILLQFRGHGGHHHHHHDHEIQTPSSGKSTFLVVASLTAMMFFSPCLEIEAYFLPASVHGWSGIFLVAAVYTLFTVAGMVLLVILGSYGIRKLRWHFLEHYERLLTGALLIALAVVSLFWKP